MTQSTQQQNLAQSGFWQHKSLQQMSRSEWEALCDGCGKCCLLKLIDGDAEESQEQVYFTDVACRLLDTDKACCSDYDNRLQRVPDCVKLTPENLADVYFMPASCAYRLLAEGKPLPAWHPLRHGGDKAAMKRAGISAAGRCISERDFAGDLEDRIVSWPL